MHFAILNERNCRALGFHETLGGEAGCDSNLKISDLSALSAF